MAGDDGGASGSAGEAAEARIVGLGPITFFVSEIAVLEPPQEVP